MTDKFKTLFILHDTLFNAYDIDGDMIKLKGNQDIFYPQMDSFWEQWEDQLGYDTKRDSPVDFCILANGGVSDIIKNKFPLVDQTSWTIAEVVNILQKQVIVLEDNLIAITEHEFKINIELLNDGQDTDKLIEQQKAEQKKLSTNKLQRYWQSVTESYTVE